MSSDRFHKNKGIKNKIRKATPLRFNDGSPYRPPSPLEETEARKPKNSRNHQWKQDASRSRDVLTKPVYSELYIQKILTAYVTKVTAAFTAAPTEPHESTRILTPSSQNTASCRNCSLFYDTVQWLILVYTAWVVGSLLNGTLKPIRQETVLSYQMRYGNQQMQISV